MHTHTLALATLGSDHSGLILLLLCNRVGVWSGWFLDYVGFELKNMITSVWFLCHYHENNVFILL